MGLPYPLKQAARLDSKVSNPHSDATRIRLGVNIMKFVALFILVGSLPVVLLLSSGGLDSRSSQSMVKTAETAPNPAVGFESKENESPSGPFDLHAASDATMRKIGEIDKKIESAKQDLKKNESARQAVIKDLIKIQAKIDSVIKSESNF